VRRRPRTFAFLSGPIDTPTLSPSPPHPSLAVSDTTTSEIRVPPRSPPSSRRRRSPTWGAPPPECLLLCQCPLTRLYSLTIPTPPLARSLGGNSIGAEGATALAAILKETQITNLRCAAAPECSLLCQCRLSHCFPPHPSLAVSDSITSDTREPLRSLLSSRRRRSPRSSAPPPLSVRFLVSAH